MSKSESECAYRFLQARRGLPSIRDRGFCHLKTTMAIRKYRIDQLLVMTLDSELVHSSSWSSSLKSVEGERSTFLRF